MPIYCMGLGYVLWGYDPNSQPIPREIGDLLADTELVLTRDRLTQRNPVSLKNRRFETKDMPPARFAFRSKKPGF